MDELKIQLEARQDFLYLKSELRKYIEENSFTSTPEQRERDVFAFVGDNIQIDGVDLDKLPAESGEEQVDLQLETQLEELQVETDKLLVDIAKLRRTCPEEIRKKFIMDVGDLERAMPGVASIIAPDPLNVKFDMDESVIEHLIRTLGKLKSLNQSIPEQIAKLRRAQTILVDSNSLNNHAVKADNEHFNEMVNRQHRINRQHDLATKLLVQQ